MLEQDFPRSVERGFDVDGVGGDEAIIEQAAQVRDVEVERVDNLGEGDPNSRTLILDLLYRCGNRRRCPGVRRGGGGRRRRRGSSRKCGRFRRAGWEHLDVRVVPEEGWVGLVGRGARIPRPYTGACATCAVPLAAVLADGAPWPVAAGGALVSTDGWCCSFLIHDGERDGMLGGALPQSALQTVSQLLDDVEGERQQGNGDLDDAGLRCSGQRLRQCCGEEGLSWPLDHRSSVRRSTSG